MLHMESRAPWLIQWVMKMLSLIGLHENEYNFFTPGSELGKLGGAGK